MSPIRKERPEGLLDALSDLEQALAAHTEWLKNWHMVVLSSINRGPIDLENTDVLKCAFIDWHRDQNHKIFNEHPLFREIGELADSMLEKARLLMSEVQKKKIIPSDEYGHFMNTGLAFNSLSRQLQNETWNTLANIDPLTGIGNRQAMIRELDRERDRVLRTGQPCCIVMADLDHFKAVNDTHGHHVGDKVLSVVSDCFMQQLRPYDSIYRYGGEEFLFCLPDTDINTAMAVSERVRKAVGAIEVTLQDGSTIKVTCSFGVSPMSGNATLEGSIDSADKALYMAKEIGRNKVQSAA